MTGRRTHVDRPVAASAALVVLLSAAVFAGSYALLTLLPERSSEERLAVEAIRLLAEGGEVRTSVATPEGRYRAGCRVLPRRREQFSVADGQRFLIEGPYARARIGGPNLPATVLQQAYLAGCPRLISRNLGRRIRRGQEVYSGATVFEGVPAHELVVVGPPTHVRLLVERETLQPLGVRLGRSAVASYLP